MATDYLTPDDVASHLQVSRQVVYNWINDGRLRAVKAGRTLRIPQYALDAFLQPVQAGDVSKDGIEPERVLLKDRFTAAAQAAMEAALAEIQKRQHPRGEIEHQLWALMQPSDGVAHAAFRQMGIDPRLVLEKLEQALAQLPTDPTLPAVRPMVDLSPRLHPVVERTEAIASIRPDLQIDASHILQAIGEETEGVTAQLLKSFGVTPERLRLALLEVRNAQPPVASPAAAHRDAGWEHRIEQTLTRIETELAAIRATLNDRG